MEFWGLAVLTCCTLRASLPCYAHHLVERARSLQRTGTPRLVPVREAALPAGGGKQGQGCSGDPPPMEMFLDKLMVLGTLGVRGEGRGWANSPSPALAAE